MWVAGTNHGPDDNDESQKETKIKWKGEKNVHLNMLHSYNHIDDCVPDIFN